MRPPKITVVAPRGESQERVERVLERWPCGLPPVVEWACGESLAAQDRRDLGVLLVLCDAEGRGAVEQVLERADQAGAPVLVLRGPNCATPCHLPPSALVLPASTDPGVVGGVLAGLASQAASGREVRDELARMRSAQRTARNELDRLHEELQSASRVQGEFMPKSLPVMDGLDLSVLFRPCGYVSGDVYDVRVLDERRVGVFLADAMGHGVPAALMTLTLCRLLPTRVPTGAGDRVLQPAEAMSRLNRALTENATTTANFATAVYAVIDVPTRHVTACGAGHPPPLRIAAGGRCSFETHGPVLGVFEDAEYDQVGFSLAAGDALVLHTDGLELAFPSSADAEALRRPNDNYLARLDALVRDWSSGSAPLGELTARLAGAIDEQAGSLRQHDDVTALVIAPRRRSASEAA